MAKKIIHILSSYDETAEKTSLLILSNHEDEKVWLNISDKVKQKLNLTLLKCTPHGKIKEIILNIDFHTTYTYNLWYESQVFR